jgi:hypothetical protein
MMMACSTSTNRTTQTRRYRKSFFDMMDYYYNTRTAMSSLTSYSARTAY